MQSQKSCGGFHPFVLAGGTVVLGVAMLMFALIANAVGNRAEELVALGVYYDESAAIGNAFIDVVIMPILPPVMIVVAVIAVIKAVLK